MEKTREQKLEDLVKYLLETGFNMRRRQKIFKDEYGFQNRDKMLKAEKLFDDALTEMSIDENINWETVHISFLKEKLK